MIITCTAHMYTRYNDDVCSAQCLVIPCVLITLTMPKILVHKLVPCLPPVERLPETTPTPSLSPSPPSQSDTMTSSSSTSSSELVVCPTPSPVVGELKFSLPAIHVCYHLPLKESVFTEERGMKGSIFLTT